MNNPTRRHFLTSAAAGLAATGFPSARAAAKPSPLSFGLLADCQYVDADTRGSRFYRESPAKLREAVAELNRHDLAFSLHLGDFIDREFRSFDVLEPIVAELRAPLHHALGNHDFEVEVEHRSAVPKRLGLERGYYAFRRPGFRFLVIDTTEVSVYRHPKDSPEHRAASEELKKLKASGSRAAQPWNSRPGDGQLAWLEKELQAAAAASETVLVFGHHPILPNEGHATWNAAAIHRLLLAHPCTKLYINGHNHAGHYVDEKGLHYLTLDGMLETKDTNAFAHADLFADRLEITGFGRQESHVLAFR